MWHRRNIENKLNREQAETHFRIHIACYRYVASIFKHTYMHHILLCKLLQTVHIFQATTKMTCEHYHIHYKFINVLSFIINKLHLKIILQIPFLQTIAIKLK